MDNLQSPAFMNTAPSFDFHDPKVDHDCVIQVEDKMFHVKSGYLSVWSEYFKGLCSGSFSNSDVKKTEVKEITASDFETFLLFIYPTQKPITADNVISLVRMAHRFLAPGVMTACKKYIEENLMELDLLGILEISIIYSLADIKRRIGSVIYAFQTKTVEFRRCEACGYCYDDERFCTHAAKKSGISDISVNSFIHDNYDRISELSAEAQCFILGASVGKYGYGKAE